jgi:hypothetical protein
VAEPVGASRIKARCRGNIPNVTLTINGVTQTISNLTLDVNP